jgi:hypothetical protein
MDQHLSFLPLPYGIGLPAVFFGIGLLAVFFIVVLRIRNGRPAMEPPVRWLLYWERVRLS